MSRNATVNFSDATAAKKACIPPATRHGTCDVTHAQKSVLSLKSQSCRLAPWHPCDMYPPPHMTCILLLVG